MKKLFPLFPVLLLLLVCVIQCKPSSDQATKKSIDNNVGVKAPVAKKILKELTIHGDKRVDNYYWLNERESPEVINYLNEENQYTQSVMKHTEALQNDLYDEIVGRIKQDDTSVPYRKNGYYYQTKYLEGKEYPEFLRWKEGQEAAKEVMLDENVLAEPHSYYAIGGLSVSPNNTILAYGEDTLSRRIYTIRFKDLKTGEMLEDVIPNTTGSVVWAEDNKTVFYTVKDKALRSYKIFKHKVGTDASKDKEVFHEDDDTFSTFVYKTKTDKYIVIGSYATLTNEYYLIDADNPDGPMRSFQPRNRKDNLEYSIAHRGDKFYIRTNHGAKNFRLMVTDEDKTGIDNWKEVIPNREDVFLQGMELFDDFMVLTERKNGIRQLRVIGKNKDDYHIDFGEDAYVAYTAYNPEMGTDIVRVGFQSMTTPSSIYDYNTKSKKLELRKQTEVVGDFKADDYKSERFFVAARDGAKVPVSVVYKKDIPLDGSAPLLLYGYGSYGSSMEPFFGAARLSLLDRGFVYAIAHIRGGQEMGRHWYEDGKLLKKKNTFTDFIDVGDYLVNNSYGDKDKLFAMGGSAGGLLVGAVMNMRPDMWKGVVARVPFVDVVTTMLDESIPLTTGEFDEWGNPKDEEYYHYIKSYSPYDNVEAKDYPNLLVTTGLHDSQVQYWEPAKWVAKLREQKTDDRTILLHTEMEAGHGGTSGRFKRNKETALIYAFLVDLAGSELKD